MGDALPDFISEDDLKTFEGWLRYQGIDPATISSDKLEEWRRIFDDVKQQAASNPKVGRMKLTSITGEYRYAVAVREGSDLWLALWVRRSRKGEFFVMLPRADKDWDPHTSYHLDGTRHMKSYDRKVLPPEKRQPLTGVFRGSEDLGAFGGYAPKGVGAICEPADFSGIVEVAPGVLGPRDGTVKVDIVGSDHELPKDFPWTRIVVQQVFRDTVPWVVITVGSLE